MKNIQKCIYTSYDEDLNMTFIVKDTAVKNGKISRLLKTEVVGFYFGEPNESDTEKYEGELKATFDW